MKWMAILLAAICFEGLGRKFLPQIPSTVFYFFKDLVLIAGLFIFGVPRQVRAGAVRAYGAFTPVFVLAVLWTLVQVFNPGQGHFGLAAVGFRAYWLWWLAPLIIAGAMHDEDARRGVIRVLGLITIAVSLFAAYQYTQPADAWVNQYALFEGKVVNDVDTVFATGRVRVSSTFSYLSGYVAFTQVVPVLLLAFGMGEKDARTRIMCLAGAALSAATLPMTGSRGGMVFFGVNVVALMWGAGALRTGVGRRMMVGIGLAVLVAMVMSRDAIDGLIHRFSIDTHETASRFAEVLEYIPIYALSEVNYPIMGVGTGMMQNAALTLGVRHAYYAESETGRVLIELGSVGYLLIWLVRIGLAVALLKGGRALRQHGRGAVAGAAYAYAFLAIFGKLAFDHVYQALYFCGLGLILHAVITLPAAVTTTQRTRTWPIRAPLLHEPNKPVLPLA